ncbi:MAG: polyphosphate polymerase domain-containing protein [Clostridium sp.]|nr:polyphosphate polymerase domain-containing protein [Clostridium sp.]MCM1399978.1 polyphosphate polymerase domain-containing protein [Clostridium sp.]MCM1460280.1 polyphosphate polymerase domain-containing protein [Bacteroides sp.]
MEDTQYSFERYEKKFLLTSECQETFLEHIQEYITEEQYHRYSICNIYYDTDDYKIIRASREKPQYKEKLRVRSYGTLSEHDKAFVELKKKYNGIVYKRRIDADINVVGPFLDGCEEERSFGQVGREIAWFQKMHQTKPKVFIGYDRVAYCAKDDADLRITFDTNIRWRDDALDLRLGDYGKLLLPQDSILMEIKISEACPMWLGRALSEAKIFPISFSKYGTWYGEHILKEEREVKSCA